MIGTVPCTQASLQFPHETMKLIRELELELSSSAKVVYSRRRTNSPYSVLSMSQS